MLERKNEDSPFRCVEYMKSIYRVCDYQFVRGFTYGYSTKKGLLILTARDAREVVAIAETSKGADTALVIKPANSKRLFNMKVKEIIAIPQKSREEAMVKLDG